MGRKWPAFRDYDLVSPNMAGKGGNSRHTATIFLEPRAVHQGSRCAIQGTLQQHQRHSVGKQWLAEQPRPLALKGDPPQLRIDLSDPSNVDAASLSVLRVRCYRPRLTFRCPWSSALASMHPAPVAVGNDGVLAGCSLAGSCQAYRARPTRPNTRCTARLEQLLAII